MDLLSIKPELVEDIIEFTITDNMEENMELSFPAKKVLGQKSSVDARLFIIQRGE